MGSNTQNSDKNQAQGGSERKPGGQQSQQGQGHKEQPGQQGGNRQPPRQQNDADRDRGHMNRKDGSK